MSDEKSYQHEKKCPKCNKRKVYLSVQGEKLIFTCKACGYTWEV